MIYYILLTMTLICLGLPAQRLPRPSCPLCPPLLAVPLLLLRPCPFPRYVPLWPPLSVQFEFLWATTCDPAVQLSLGTGLGPPVPLPEAVGPAVRLLTWIKWGVSSSSVRCVTRVAIALYPVSVRWTGSVPNNLSSFSGSASHTRLKYCYFLRIMQLFVEIFDRM